MITQNETQNTGPLTEEDLSVAEKSFRLWEPTIGQWVITKVELLDNEAGTVKFELKNTEPVRDTKGDSEEVGRAMLFTQINTKVTGKSTKDIIRNGIIDFVRCFGVQLVATRGEDTQGNPHAGAAFREKSPAWVGQIGKLRVGIRPAGPDKKGIFRQAQNQVDEWIPKGQ